MSLSGIAMNVLEALTFIANRLRRKKIKWVLMGSTSLALQGVKVEPRDIDILTDKEGAFKIGELLKGYEVRPVSFGRTKLFESYLGEFRINNVKVQVAGDMKERSGSKTFPLSRRLTSHKITRLKGVRLPVSDLHDQLESYERLGRQRDAVKIRKIKEALERKSPQYRES